jgi:hypothetical protein
MMNSLPRFLLNRKERKGFIYRHGFVPFVKQLCALCGKKSESEFAGLKNEQNVDL